MTLEFHFSISQLRKNWSIAMIDSGADQRWSIAFFIFNCLYFLQNIDVFATILLNNQHTLKVRGTANQDVCSVLTNDSHLFVAILLIFLCVYPSFFEPSMIFPLVELRRMTMILTAVLINSGQSRAAVFAAKKSRLTAMEPSIQG